jgi:hypothetical protein
MMAEYNKVLVGSILRVSGRRPRPLLGEGGLVVGFQLGEGVAAELFEEGVGEDEGLDSVGADSSYF